MTGPEYVARALGEHAYALTIPDPVRRLEVLVDAVYFAQMATVAATVAGLDGDGLRYWQTRSLRGGSE